MYFIDPDSQLNLSPEEWEKLDLSDLLFTFEKIADMDEPDLITLLKLMPLDTLAKALFGSEERVISTISQHLEPAAQQNLQDSMAKWQIELEQLKSQDPARLEAEVAEARKEVLKVAHGAAMDDLVALFPRTYEKSKVEQDNIIY